MTVNKKEGPGRLKVSMSVVPGIVLAEISVALMEGALVYGSHNYRDSEVKCSTYYDAAMRHLLAWWEGEDIDAKSGISHVTKAISGLIVLRDCMMNGVAHDDRPATPSEMTMDDINALVVRLRQRMVAMPPAPADEPGEGDTCD